MSAHSRAPRPSSNAPTEAKQKVYKELEEKRKANKNKFFQFYFDGCFVQTWNSRSSSNKLLRAQKKRNNKSILQKRVNKKTWSVLAVAVDTFFSAKERMSQRRKRRKRVFSFDDPQIRVDELILFVSGWCLMVFGFWKMRLTRFVWEIRELDFN